MLPFRYMKNAIKKEKGQKSSINRLPPPELRLSY